MRSSKKILCCILAMGAVCGLSACGKDGIPLPDLKTEYVESGFVEYYKLVGDPSWYPPDAVFMYPECAYRLHRTVEESQTNIEVTLCFGGGADEEDEFTHVEIYFLTGEEKHGIRTISKDEYLTEEYKIKSQVIYHDEEGCRGVRTEYTHSETFSIPMAYFSEDEGTVGFCAEGYVGEKACYGRCYLALHYTKEDEELHFMSHREYVYVKYGLLAYYA